MADRNNSKSNDVLKKLSDGKTLCSEMNNASSNTNFLFMRRHDAMILHLESTKQNLVAQNQRAQNEMKKQLQKYIQRKKIIMRDRLLSQQDQAEDSEYAPSLARPATGATLCSSIGRRSSGSAFSGTSSVRLPSILSWSLGSSGDREMSSSSMSRHHKVVRLKRHESLNFQLLSSKVYEFCSLMDTERNGTDSFFITSAKRHIAFNESKTHSRVTSGCLSTAQSRKASANRNQRALNAAFRRRQPALPAAVAAAAATAAVAT